jgi:hypothetical protein
MGNVSHFLFKTELKCYVTIQVSSNLVVFFNLKKF